MKNFTLLFLHFFLANTLVFGQCPTGSVSLTSQTEVDAFVASYPTCSLINGDLKISGLDIHDLSGLSNIKETKGDFIIENTPNLKSIAFDNLTTVGNGFHIKNTAAKTASFNKLTKSNGKNEPFTIINNSFLKNLNISKLKSIKGRLIITDNTSLSSIDIPYFFNHGVTDEGYIRIKNNMNLKSINIERLAVASSITIEDNQRLNTLQLNRLKRVGESPVVTGRLSIKRNPLLSILYLAKLETAFYLVIEDTNIDLLDLKSVRIIDKDLSIKNNTELKEFDLSTLKNVRHLEINNNPKLATVNSLQNLNLVYGNLTLTNNTTLTNCKGLCNILNDDGVSGTVTIVGNPSECSNQGEVVASCTSLGLDHYFSHLFNVYPNPTRGLIHVNKKLRGAHYRIFSTKGILLLKDVLKTNTIDISTFKNGTYYLSIVKGKQVEFKKIVKK